MSRRSKPRSLLVAIAVLLAVVLLASACGDDATTEAGAEPNPDPGTSSDTPADVADDSGEAPGGCDTTDWVTVDVGKFTFQTPTDLVDQEAQGIDSLVGEYSRPGMTVGFDYGWYSPNFDDLVEAGATVSKVTVGSHEGTFVQIDLSTVPAYEGNLFVGLHVPDVEVADGAASALAMWVNYDDDADTAVATCITETITLA